MMRDDNNTGGQRVMIVRNKAKAYRIVYGYYLLHIFFLCATNRPTSSARISLGSVTDFGRPV